jgi:hypothetical protein
MGQSYKVLRFEKYHIIVWWSESLSESGSVLYLTKGHIIAVTSISTLHTCAAETYRGLIPRHRDMFRTDRAMKLVAILATKKVVGNGTANCLQAWHEKRAMEIEAENGLRLYTTPEPCTSAPSEPARRDQTRCAPSPRVPGGPWEALI